MRQSVISQVNVALREDGNIAISYNNVPVTDLVDLFEKEYPDYVYLSTLKNYMKDLDIITNDYLDAIDELGLSEQICALALPIARLPNQKAMMALKIAAVSLSHAICIAIVQSRFCVAIIAQINVPLTAANIMKNR